MKQIIVSISHNQGHQTITQIENVLKNAGLSPGEAISGLINDRFFYRALAEHLEKKGHFVSEIFRKMNTFEIPRDTILFPVHQASIMEFLREAFADEYTLEEGPRPFVDPKIWEDFRGMSFKRTSKDPFFVSCYRFLKKLDHYPILEEAKRTGRATFSFFDALCIVRERISSKFLRNGREFIVYFKVNDDAEDIYFFWVRRDSEDCGRIKITKENAWYLPGFEVNADVYAFFG